MNDPDGDIRDDAVVNGVDVDALAAAVRSCPAVIDLAQGEPGSAATYLPGRRIPGLAVREARVTVQVSSRWGVPVGEVAAQIRAAAKPLVAGRPLDIVVADIDDPPAGSRPAERHPTRSSSRRGPAPSPTLTPPVRPVRPDHQEAGR